MVKDYCSRNGRSAGPILSLNDCQTELVTAAAALLHSQIASQPGGQLAGTESICGSPSVKESGPVGAGPPKEQFLEEQLERQLDHARSAVHAGDYPHPTLIIDVGVGIGQPGCVEPVDKVRPELQAFGLTPFRPVKTL
jgi:hypothetical protein